MTDLPSTVGVVVVGAGFAGIATTAALLAAGRRDFVVLERAQTVGGTWRDNSYPGCACDVPSHLYSLSFAPNPDWTRSFSSQPEIQAYLEKTARDVGMLPFTRFGVELLSASWDTGRSQWHIVTSSGEIWADVLVAGTGGLSEPATPDITGLADFQGTTFHSAAWRHDHDLTGDRVAVIGTGASAIQFVPHVRRQAAHVTVFQRTPPWVLPRRDREIGRAERAAYRRFPALMKLPRGGIYASREATILGFSFQPQIMAQAERQALRFLEQQVPDPVLRAKLVPSYRLGCKRVLLSNDYFRALTKPNVHVETDRIAQVLPRAIVTESTEGARTVHEVDTLILGTGFRITDQPVADRITGADGRTLAQHWESGGMQALHGTTVAGFPNYFHVMGPNTGIGHTSAVYMIESQVSYFMQALELLQRPEIAALEPRPDAVSRFNVGIQKRLQRTVWNRGGCSSWYLDSAGRNTTLWPTFTFSFRRRLARFPVEDYIAHAPHVVPAGAP